MYGAILGDMIGSPYEFDRGSKTKDFPLFTRKSTYTDDTVMTCAVAEVCMEMLVSEQFHREPPKSDDWVRAQMTAQMRRFGAAFPNAGYGGMFRQWLESPDPRPYGSFGNGSAMRVSAVAWLFPTVFKVRRMARLSAEVTHNHPEGIKGAEAAASAIFLARSGCEKPVIKSYIEEHFGYDLSRTLDEIRPGYHHVETCQQTVPEAIIAFLEGDSFEDVIRNAVSLGGDCDTLTDIAGAIAEGFYGVPEELKRKCRRKLPPMLRETLRKFDLALEFIEMQNTPVED